VKYPDMTKNTFGDVRKSNLQRWLHHMDRQRSEDNLDDIYTNSFECQWQEHFTRNNKLKSDHPDKFHNSIFCSMGDWVTQISDWLCDERFDNLHYWYEDKEHALFIRQVLFRHYTRFYLLVSEVITDLADLTDILLSEHDHYKARSFLSLNKDDKQFPNWVDELMDYINSICKHKIGSGNKFHKLHLRNHHTPLSFIDNNEKQTKGRIKVYGLKEIIDIIHNGYCVVNSILPDNYHKLEKYELTVSKVLKRAKHANQ